MKYKALVTYPPVLDEKNSLPRPHQMLHRTAEAAEAWAAGIVNVAADEGRTGVTAVVVELREVPVWGLTSDWVIKEREKQERERERTNVEKKGTKK